MTSVTPRRRVVLVGCAHRKLPTPAPARNLNSSTLFRSARGYAESSRDPWYILSAEHGLVLPTEWMSPYDRVLSRTPPAFRDAWGGWVAARLEFLEGGLSDVAVEVHAGRNFIAPIQARLIQAGAEVLDPLAGLTIGKRLAWYRAHAGDAAALPRVIEGERSERAAELTANLILASLRKTPSDFLAGGRERWNVPGLYSWWVDGEGAADLAEGLGLPFHEGLVYSGLAGATRWPSGTRSTYTLWDRIRSMHLGRRHEYSTLRHSVGAILAAQRGDDEIDEEALTGWMHHHLVIAVVPFEDRDTLGRIESEVLAQLDPPLNLYKVASTPVRRRVSELRSALRHGKRSRARDAPDLACQS